MSTEPVYFDSADLARWCATDGKTIHNWVNRGKLPAFRTPGRHLRFRPAEVHAFLKRYGYDIPPAVTVALGSGGAT